MVLLFYPARALDRQIQQEQKYPKKQEVGRRHLGRLRVNVGGLYSANRVARQIPMTRIPWNEAQPGHLEIDLVHHCGPNAQGEYVHTLQMIDVATGWSERVAVLGRSYLVMSDAFRYIRQRLPFAMLELHSDNGTEFLNQHLLRFWKEEVPELYLTRSRPYQEERQPLRRAEERYPGARLFRQRPTRLGGSGAGHEPDL